MTVYVVVGEYGNSAELDGYEILGVYEDEGMAVDALDALTVGQGCQFYTKAVHVRRVERARVHA